MHHQNGQDNNILKGVVAGAVSGLVATWVMTQFQNTVSQMMESNGKDKEQDRQQNEEESETATIKAASAISETLFDHELKKSEKEGAGNAVHYGFGMTMGAVYGAASEILPITSKGYGFPFGTLLFIGADEIAVPALGLGESSTETPLSTHAYGLASHLVYGLTSDFVRRAVRRAL